MQAKESVDMLIRPGWVLPMAPQNGVLADHAVAVDAGRIVALGPWRDLDARYEPRELVQRPGHALLPGFVNAHTHAAMVLLRGLPVRAPLMRWLRETVWPAEQRLLSPNFVRDGTRLALAEMLRAGITSFADVYLFPEEAARVAAAARMRAVIGLPIADTASVWADNALSYLDKAEHLWDEYRDSPWVSLYFAPHAPYSVGDVTLTRLRRVADELDARVAMHVHETEVEVHESLALHQKRPLKRLADLGLLRPGFSAIHMNRLIEEDLELAARTGIAVVACPQSNLRLGSGSAPIAQLLARGIPTGLGTDGPASVGALDMLAEARTSALIAASARGTREALPAASALQLATLASAQAIGLGSEVGSIEPGKAADLVCWDLHDLACQPCESPADALVFSGTRAQAKDVWVAGQAMVCEGRLLAFDETELLALATQWQEHLRVGAAA